MIEIVKSAKPYVPEIGDLVCEWHNPDSSEYLDSDDNPVANIIPLCTICPHPFQALDFLGINYKNLISKYNCPYTGYEHFAIVPTALFLLKGSKESYPSRIPNKDYVFDYEWHNTMAGSRGIRYLLKLTPIQEILMGSGYTSFNGFHDGSGCTKQTKVNLNNGDALWVSFWEWYNK